MANYWVKTNAFIRWLFPKYIWNKPKKNAVYLTFDDGPHPVYTPWVLEQLKIHNAKATFFCIGDNICNYPAVFAQIVREGHRIGNHTQHHLNGWNTPTENYLVDALQCENTLKNHINKKDFEKKLFRPPYGKIKGKQAQKLQQHGYEIVMWDIISGDFDSTISKEKCSNNVLKNLQDGSIVVFHDSEKAATNMQYALLKTLAYCKNKSLQLQSL